MSAITGVESVDVREHVAYVIEHSCKPGMGRKRFPGRLIAEIVMKMIFGSGVGVVREHKRNLGLFGRLREADGLPWDCCHVGYMGRDVFCGQSVFYSIGQGSTWTMALESAGLWKSRTRSQELKRDLIRGKKELRKLNRECFEKELEKVWRTQ